MSRFSPSLKPNNKYQEHYGYNLRGGLINYRIALSNSANQYAKIYCIGDSLTRGEYSSIEWSKSWVGQLRSLLQTKYGNAPGEGFIGAYETLLPSGAQPRWTLGTGGWKTTITAGFGGYTSFSSGATTAMTGTFSGTSVTLLYATDPSGGNGNVSIDGVAQTAINCNGASTDFAQSIQYTGLAAGSHTITITPATTANVFIQGLIENTASTSGVQVNRQGVSGWMSSNWQDSRDFAIWSALPPDLAIIGLGMNDAHSTNNVSIAAYKTNMRNIITQLQATGASVLLVAYQQPDSAWTGSTPWSSFVQAMYDLADEYNTGLVDIYQSWGRDYSYAQGRNLYGLTTNNWSGNSGSNEVHPGDKGYNYIAQTMYRALVLN